MQHTGKHLAMLLFFWTHEITNEQTNKAIYWGSMLPKKAISIACRQFLRMLWNFWINNKIPVFIYINNYYNPQWIHFCSKITSVLKEISFLTIKNLFHEIWNNIFQINFYLNFWKVPFKKMIVLGPK